MGNNAEQVLKGGRLESLLLVSWYITVGSAVFDTYLLRIHLPIGGHLFLFRIAILFTCLLYALVLLRRRENPFLGLSKIELYFLTVAVCMLVYGVISAIWAISLGAWFSKFFTMCQMFALVFLFLKLCRNEKVMRITLLLIASTALICAVGGLVECFHGHFFNTPYGGRVYEFFNIGLYAPIFTLYNPNGFAVYLLFVLEILYLAMAFSWERLGPQLGGKILYALSAGMGLTLFLCCADGGRLATLSIPIILCGLAVWLIIGYRKGLLVFIGLALCLLFIYVGENYNEVKYQVEQAEKRIQEIFSPAEEPPVERPFDEESPDPNDVAVPDTTPPPKNAGGTLYSIASSVAGSGKTESLQQSDRNRVTLLKNSIRMLIKSKGLGIGLGNAEPRMQEIGNTRVANVHCFIMEVFLEFGIFAIVPLLFLVAMIFKTLFIGLHIAVINHSREPIANILFLAFTTLAFLLLSTANASSWGIVPMWLYIAQVLLYSGRMESRHEDMRAE